MTENADLANVPEAMHVPKKRSRLPVVWIVPIVAALVGVGIVVQKYLNEGPTIRIIFPSAEGIEAEKTLIKYKDVEIGKVTHVNLTDNHTKILVTAKMEKSAEGMLDNDARFWLVKPQISLSGVSGIGTLLSGNYIGFEPGKSKGKRLDFFALEAPPPIMRDRPGREFALRADTLGSLGLGSPVYYRSLDVGDVVSFNLAKDGRSMDIRIFVNAPHDKFVTADTRFWESSGIDAKLGADGLSLRTASMTALIAGGITFEAPSFGPAAEAPPNTVFTLFKDRTTALAPPQKDVRRFVLRFRESMRGLSVGAPVEFLGMAIGEVTAVGLEYNQQAGDFRPRVEIATYSYRFTEHMDKKSRDVQAAKTIGGRTDALDHMVVDKGLRAQLRTGSLVSGQLFVAVDYFPDAPKAKIDKTQDPPEFPVVAGKMAELEDKLNNFVAKLDKVPVEEIGNDLKKVLETLDTTLKSADRTLTRVDAETLPEAKKTLEDLRRAATAAERLLNSTDNTLLGPDAPAQQELRDALQEFTRAARAIGMLADYLERNPETLLRGKNKENP
jgi:paraquat-inducible protein B